MVIYRGVFFAPSYYENDYYRYIWDGLVTANGMNPLVIAPAEMIDGYPTFGWG